MRWQKRGVSDIIATRKEFRTKMVHREPGRRSRVETEEGDGKMEGLLRKGEFTLEDKVEMVRHIEKKCRIYFSELFSMGAFEVVLARDMRLVEKEYEPSKRSYFVMSGRVVVSGMAEAVMLTEEEEKEEEDEGVQRLDKNRIVIQSQAGIGWVFSNERYCNCRIQAQGILIKITHNTSTSLSLIEKDCIMTNRERQLFLKRFKLFSSIQNLNKFYLPFFEVRKYSKGECIYSIDDAARELFLIIEGNVAFESMVCLEYPDEGANRRGVKRTRKEELLFVTETINKENFFGQEEILSQTNRKQNARCTSIECKVMAIPQDKLEKLLSVPEFKRSLQLSSILKLDARQHQISNFLILTKSKQLQPSTISPQNIEKFGELKTALFTQLYEPKEQTAIRSRYSKDKKRILHNHSLSIPEQGRAKTRVTDFSMLNVNRLMYEKTLMRFRYNLKELQKLSQPKQKAFPSRGRSLDEIWKTLKLEKSFNPEEERIVIDEDDGMTYYNTHKRLLKQIRVSRCFRPKSLSCSNKLKTEYIEYLQMVI